MKGPIQMSFDQIVEVKDLIADAKDESSASLAQCIQIRTKEREFIIKPDTSNIKCVWLCALKAAANLGKPASPTFFKSFQQKHGLKQARVSI